VSVVVVNPFVTRQTKGSRFSHADRSWDALVSEAEAKLSSARPGYREGVILVDIDPSGVWSGVTVLQEGDAIVGTYEARRPGETPRQSFRSATGTKSPAVSAFLVLYRSDVLAEDGSNTLPPTTENWEIVSLNAAPVPGDMPIDPWVLMHNHFGSDGGTATNMTPEQFEAALRTSFTYWKDKVMA
jgi:hypothetical protein